MSTKAAKVRDATAVYVAGTEAPHVPPGYKRTEVGVIPKDWLATTLGSLATFRTGPFGSALHKADYVKDGIPLVNPMHIVDGTVVPDSSVSVSEHAARRLADFQLRPGDIVIGRRGEMGRCALIQSAHAGWLCGTGSLIIRCADSARPEFVRRILTTREAITQIEEASVGSTMVNLNQAALARLHIALPPPSEQRAIAKALSDADGLLGALEALIAKKRAIKQAAMQQLLTGKTRLPGFTGEWETKRLADLGHWRGGLTPLMANPGYWVEGTIPWLTSSDIRRGSIGSPTGKITEKAIRETGVPVIRPDSVIVVIRSGILRRFLPVASNASPVAINQDLRALEPASHHHPGFLVQALSAFERRLLQECLKAGTTVESIDSGWFRGFEVAIPDLEEQEAIATVLSDIDAEIAALERRRDKTREIKQGMMQQLLTGRVRLVEPGRPGNDEEAP